MVLYTIRKIERLIKMQNSKELIFCPIITMQLVESDTKLMKFYHDGFENRVNKDQRLSHIFNVAVLYQSLDKKYVEAYKELTKEYRFCVRKMRVLANRDGLLTMVLKDLRSNKHTEEEALLIIFNSYVWEDSTMREVYKDIFSCKVI